jgi:hypothetical protein
MNRALVALAAALAALLAACGPDCDKFCRHWVNDCSDFTHATDFQQCVNGCNEVGSDYAAFINCVADKSCNDLKAGHCQIPSIAPGIFK